MRKQAEQFMTLFYPECSVIANLVLEHVSVCFTRGVRFLAAATIIINFTYINQFLYTTKVH